MNPYESPTHCEGAVAEWSPKKWEQVCGRSMLACGAIAVLWLIPCWMFPAFFKWVWDEHELLFKVIHGSTCMWWMLVNGAALWAAGRHRNAGE